MAQELVYTSSPKGIKAGSCGFCTVAYTEGMAFNHATLLEAYSAYLPVYQVFDDNAHLNPVSFSHYRYSTGANTIDIVSRVCYAGLDYTKRSNKIAHHIILEPAELSQSGPADFIRLFSDSKSFIESWHKDPEILKQKILNEKIQKIKSLASPFRKSDSWKKVAGNEAWSAVLADAYLRDKNKASFVIFDPERHSDSDRLSLIEESLMLLPPEDRWQLTFNTYFSALPQGTKCAWRFCVRNSDALKDARRTPGTVVIDLNNLDQKLLANIKNSDLINFARSDEDPHKKSPASTSKTDRPKNQTLSLEDELSEKTEDLRSPPIAPKKDGLRIQRPNYSRSDSSSRNYQQKKDSTSKFPYPQVAIVLLVLGIFSVAGIFYYRQQTKSEIPRDANWKIEELDEHGRLVTEEHGAEKPKPSQTDKKQEETKKDTASATNQPEDTSKKKTDQENKAQNQTQEKAESVPQTPAIPEPEPKEPPKEEAKETPKDSGVKAKESKKAPENKENDKAAEEKKKKDEEAALINGQRCFWMHWKKLCDGSVKKGKQSIPVPGQKKDAKLSIETVEKSLDKAGNKKESFGKLEVAGDPSRRILRAECGVDELGLKILGDVAEIYLEKDGLLIVEFKKEDLETQKPIKAISKLTIEGKEYGTKFHPPLPDGLGKAELIKINPSSFDKDKSPLISFTYKIPPDEKGIIGNHGEEGFELEMKYKNKPFKKNNILTIKDLLSLQNRQFSELNKPLTELANMENKAKGIYERIKKDLPINEGKTGKLVNPPPSLDVINENTDEALLIPEKYKAIKERGAKLDEEITRLENEMKTRPNDDGAKANLKENLKEKVEFKKYYKEIEFLKTYKKNYDEWMKALCTDISAKAKELLDKNKSDFSIEISGHYGKEKDVLLKTIRF